MSVWFTSDIHIGHQKIAQLRAEACDVTSIINEELATTWHDGFLAYNWDRHVNPGDQVWVLGDTSAGGKQAQLNALRWLMDRPGEKHLIAGNHDGIHPMHRDAHKWVEEYFQVFKSVQAFARRKIAGRSVLMSHFPYFGDHTETERFDQYRLRDCGELLLHGHVHSTDKVIGRQIHVGVDAWEYRPVHLDELAALIEGVKDAQHEESCTSEPAPAP